MIFDIDIHAHLINPPHRGRLRFPNHCLEVFEYTPPFLKSSTNPVKQNDFKTNELRIAYATARTLCSYHLDKKELYFDIVASLLSHFNFITRNSQHYLLLKESRLNRLRDFSKTTRIGELAQGINYLFIQEKLDYPFIIDFHLFYEKVYSTPCATKKTPDFVVLKKDLKQIGLLESKGEASQIFNVTGNTGKLQKALNQLQSIKTPCADELIPCCTRFENDGKTNNSGIHYTKISNTCKAKSDFALKIFKQHFASWFYLVGDFNRASNLIEDEVLEGLENDGRYELGTDDKEEKVYWLKRPVTINIDTKNNRSFIHVYTHFMHHHDFNIGIYESVVKQLVSGSLSSESFSFSTDSEGSYKRFADGTLIKLRTS